MSEQTVQETGRYNREDHQKCIDLLRKFNEESSELTGHLIILDEFLHEDGPYFFESENRFFVLNAIMETVSTARKVLERIHEDMMEVL